MIDSRGKALADWTDAELNESLNAGVERVSYSPANLAAEVERRRDRRSQRLATVAAVSSAFAAIASAAAAFLSLSR